MNAILSLNEASGFDVKAMEIHNLEVSVCNVGNQPVHPVLGAMEACRTCVCVHHRWRECVRACVHVEGNFNRRNKFILD
jgi:hypothetical protein